MTTADRSGGQIGESGALARILLATDGSPQATLAARKAVAISKGTGAEIHVVHVWQSIPSPHYRAFIRRELEHQGREVLEAAVWYAESIGGRVAGAHLVVGQSVEGILSVQEEIGADLIVVGSRGLGAIGRAIMGSVSTELARRAASPVLVVHGEEKGFPVREKAGAAERSTR